MLSARHSAKLQVFYPVLLLLLSMLSIQSGASLAKSLFPVIGAPAVTALRLLLGTLILFFIFKPWRLKFTRESIIPLFLYGLSLGMMNYLFYLALETIPLGIAVALEFTGPLAVAMFSSRRAIDFLWIILVIAGLGLLLPIGDNIHGLDPLGILYALGAGVGWALYIVFGQRAGKGYGAATVSIGSLVAAFIFVPIGMLQSSPDIMFSWSILPVALAIAILSTAFPYTLEMIALTRLPAKTFGTLMSLEPCMGAFIGIIFLHEHLTLIQWVALAFIVLASIGSTATIKSKTKIEEVK
ncbi:MULTISPECIES: threonine/homoserine exporter RhtA [Proteus]|uniref:Threonine/homoserine exporter RhtA n=1 Tax=Proteus terrae subsp. cibarius TaxID=626774 RepID=A0A6G6S7P9_9GAMM|nr:MULTISPECIES: threonine/homoserine exporter RhtA [Proteus]KLU19648.1 threonine transporter RhtB [Proteus mirabilis]QHP75785.1 threonine/homoserine exporter RhtA [Proteus vulgaris]MBG2838590.1 threonine/homoserine exporter RhtA [Proteus terrae subsp. cibarius]MBG2868898.1 threonine/homoserine exporter RhtA [Proteus terrae subsp. cibarius]MBG2915428.1 threonine/homoserine exporter RhtA [Proteus terrae subsp. cibarius]